MEKYRIRNNIRRLTQEQLADKVGVTRQTILAIESAKYSPSLELAFKISEVFGLPLGDVFSYTSSDTPGR
jgi:putative transcriptional regulator